MNISLDQLSYVLERKFININVGQDVQLACSAQLPDEYGNIGLNDDAWITEWRIPSIPKPTDDDISSWWDKLKDQYHSNPDRPDSLMNKYMEKNRIVQRPTIMINNEI